VRRIVGPCLLVVCVVDGLVAGRAGAEDRGNPLLKLPTPGAWAKYRSSVKPQDGNETVATMMVKSLSATKVDGAACRWLEYEYFTDESATHERRKYLIPEVALRMSERPSDRILRYLQRDGDRPVVQVPPENQGWMPSDFLYFPGVLKSSEPVDDPRTVTHKKGSFEIPKAYVGTYRWWRKGADPETGTVWETEYRVWLHPDLPVGFAHARAQLKSISNGAERRSWQLEYTLQEFGDDPKSVIVEETAPPIEQ